MPGKHELVVPVVSVSVAVVAVAVMVVSVAVDVVLEVAVVAVAVVVVAVVDAVLCTQTPHVSGHDFSTCVLAPTFNEVQNAANAGQDGSSRRLLQVATVVVVAVSVAEVAEIVVRVPVNVVVVAVLDVDVIVVVVTVAVVVDVVGMHTSHKIGHAIAITSLWSPAIMQSDTDFKVHRLSSSSPLQTGVVVVVVV